MRDERDDHRACSDGHEHEVRVHRPVDQLKPVPTACANRYGCKNYSESDDNDGYEKRAVREGPYHGGDCLMSVLYIAPAS